MIFHLCVSICIFITFCVFFSVDGHLGSFHILTIVSNAAMDVAVQYISSRPCFHFFWVCVQGWNCWIIYNSIFNLLEESPYCFHSECTMLYHFTFPPTEHKSSNFSASSPTVVVLCDLDSSHLEVVSY